MRCQVSLLVSLLSQMCWAQDDTSYQPAIGERAAALPYPVPRGDHPHRGGGGAHQHGHGSNKELSISLMHISEDLKKFSNDVESRLDEMFKVLEDLRKEQQKVSNLMMVLAYGGGGSFRGKRSTDDYGYPTDDYGYPYEPEYPTTTTRSPPYTTSLVYPVSTTRSPAHTSPEYPTLPPYFPSPPVYDSHTPEAPYSTQNTKSYNPMGMYDLPAQPEYYEPQHPTRSPPSGYSTTEPPPYTPSPPAYDSYTTDEPQYPTTEPPQYTPSPPSYDSYTSSPPYAPAPPAYHPYTSSPSYTPSPPSYDPYTPRATYSTRNTGSYNPMGIWSSSSNDVYDDLPGTISKRTLHGSSSSLPGYSGSVVTSYSRGSSGGYSGYTTSGPATYPTDSPANYDAMPSFYQGTPTTQNYDDIEELEYEEYAV